MKKLLSLLLILVLAFSLVSCVTLYGGYKVQQEDLNDAQDEMKDSIQEVQDAVADGASPEDVQDALDDYGDVLEDYKGTIDGNVNGFDSIDEYVSAIKGSAEYVQSADSLEGTGMTMDVVAEGNDLVYIYTYTVPVVEDARLLLEQSFLANEELMETSADTIRIEAPCVEKVIWRYYSVDGELLYSNEK